LALAVEFLAAETIRALRRAATPDGATAVSAAACICTWKAVRGYEFTLGRDYFRISRTLPGARGTGGRGAGQRATGPAPATAATIPLTVAHGAKFTIGHGGLPIAERASQIGRSTPFGGPDPAGGKGGRDRVLVGATRWGNTRFKSRPTALTRRAGLGLSRRGNEKKKRELHLETENWIADSGGPPGPPQCRQVHAEFAQSPRQTAQGGGLSLSPRCIPNLGGTNR